LAASGGHGDNVATTPTAAEPRLSTHVPLVARELASDDVHQRAEDSQDDEDGEKHGFPFRLSTAGRKVRGDAMNAGSLPALNKRAKSRGGMA
jgi:hypothetical protein